MPTTPGYPINVPPAYAVPVFSNAAIPVGGSITDVTLVCTSPIAKTNVLFTFGQPFKKGDVAPADFLVGRISGEADVPLQFNVQSTHPDGSVRYGIVSGVLPALSAGASKIMGLIRATTSTANTVRIASSAFTTAGFSAEAIFDFAGVPYTAALAPVLAANAAADKAYLSGSIATEYSIMMRPVNASAVPHGLLSVQFNVRYYPGAAAFKVDITSENTDAYSPNADIAYNGSLKVNNSTVYTMPSPLTHFPGARWMKSYWVNNDYPVHVKHNIAYFIATKQVANYDTTVVMVESTLASYAAELALTTKYLPMAPGPFNPYMPAAGGRPDIGLLPGFAAATVLSMDKRAKDLTIAAGVVGGGWSTHYRDVSNGPGKGMPLSVINWPYATILGTFGDASSPWTGQNERFPTRITVSTLEADDAHLPNMPYLPYLLTGDLYFLEELQFYATWLVYRSNPGYRLWDEGRLIMTQMRAQGWSLRTVAEAAALTPDNHPLKSHFQHWVNRTLFDHNSKLTDNPTANTLGINPTDIPYTVAGFPGNGIAPWQDDHFTSSVGHVAELGFTEAGRLLLWKAKFQVGRMIATGVCWIHAAAYILRVRNDASTSVIYSSLQEAYNNTVTGGMDYLTPAVHALPCNSQARLDEMNRTRPMPSNPFLLSEMTGYGGNTDGYPANFQPALAMAADSGFLNGDLAWTLFQSRTNKPNYGTSPQFAIVSRGVFTAMALPPDTYTVPSGQIMYIGKAAAASAQSFDSLSYLDMAGGGIPGPSENGLIFVVELHGSSGANYRQTGRQYRAAVSGSMAIPGTAVVVDSTLNYDSFSTFGFSVVYAYETSSIPSGSMIKLRPIDRWYNSSNIVRESAHIGFKLPDGKVHLISERRYDAMMAFADTLTQFDQNRRVLTGGSMGGWGTATYGVRRYAMFAALYPDRPRWQHDNSTANVAIPDFANGFDSVPISSSPLLAAEDGGGSFATYIDMVSYVANPANKVRWIGWCIGRQDGYATFQDSVNMVNALRSAKRGFCFVWNNGDHGTGSIMAQITYSYPYGTFSRNKGYPLFTEHSGDLNPAVDLAGGINEGLTFRNVVETNSSWSCEVTSVLGARTVNVEPISDVFTTAVTKKFITIPAANSWIPVTF